MGNAPTYTDQLMDYLHTVGIREHPVMKKCREDTAQRSNAIMQIAPEQGAFLFLLTRILGTKNALEFGVFTGYSSLAVTLAMPDDGRLIAFDKDEETVSTAKQYWADAGVTDKIDLRIGAALDHMNALIDAEAGQTRFDFAFIDADKRNYDNYYEGALKLLRPGGVIAIDNVLWAGRIADPAETDATTQSLRDLNEKISKDDRVDICLATMGDGLFLCRKK